MALVERYHVVAAEREVASGETIKEGQIVSLNTLGEVVLQSATYTAPYGIAGDTKSTSASAMPGIASGWQNRASDSFDETSASGKMTVYHSGGEFATDQFSANVASATVGDALYANNGLNIVILDACRNNPFSKSFRSSSKGLAVMDAPQGSILAYATSPGNVAYDGEGRNSPYTKALAKQILEPNLQIEEVFKRVRISVVKETGNEQVPWEASSLMGNFYFLEN